MTKKNFLELLIKSFDLEPSGVKHYRTGGCDGQFEIGVGWEGNGVNENGDCVISFAEPDGFNMAVHEILLQAKNNDLRPVYVSDK